MTGFLPFDAFIFGIISSVALPIGALIAFRWTPRPKVLASMMAMGAGALLAALTIDLVSESMANGKFYPLAGGMITGGIFFAMLNLIVNGNGGFLRKTATTLTHIYRKQNHRQKLLFNRLSKVQFFHNLTPRQASNLVPYLSRFRYREGKMMVHEGDPGDMFYIIESGSAIVMDDKTNNVVSIISANDTYGLTELLTGRTHKYSVVVKEEMHVWVINKEKLDSVLMINQELAEEMKKMVSENIHILEVRNELDEAKAEAWYSEAMHHFVEKRGTVTDHDIDEEAKEHGNVSIAIWLGMMLDGIPESIVIGSSLLLEKSMSLSLLAGLFLSNLPEALSSSVGMRKQKMTNRKIFIMWTSIMVVSGISAFAGNLLFENVSQGTYALADGMAAGAMLTMIAETMLPEAFHIGGSVTGLSALAGFLVTLLFKVL
jgi:zinc transporter ZupT